MQVIWAALKYCMHHCHEPQSLFRVTINFLEGNALYFKIYELINIGYTFTAI